MRYIGIDFGTKKIGVATSDEAGTMGFPHGVIASDDRAVATVAALAQEIGAGGIVMGESRNYAGQENPVAKEASAFARELELATGLPVHLEPEMLTTQEARRMPDGTRIAGGIVDASAAALILSSYLERHDND